MNLQPLHEHLAAEHGYTRSYKSVQRYVRAKFPPPKVRTRRRVETPPGAQSQVEWGEYPGVVVGGLAVDLHGFHMVLSHSRMDAIVWSEREDQLAWLHVHNEAFRRLDGVAAVARVDNVKTAVVKGAGPWGTLNETYRRYAQASAANPVTRKQAPKVDLDTTREKLTRLGLVHASEHVGETLATCAWIRSKENLLIQGPPGVGKTHLAIGLAIRAIENGFSVAFQRYLSAPGPVSQGPGRR